MINILKARGPSLCSFRIYSILIIIMLLLSLTLTVMANIYVIKDKKGNVVRVTNQHQMLKKEKDTATGYPAGYGSIATDPHYGMFRYGDVLYVEGYGLGVADDCGSAIKGKHIDVCFNLGELQRADNWGRKYVRVWKIE